MTHGRLWAKGFRSERSPFNPHGSHLLIVLDADKGAQNGSVLTKRAAQYLVDEISRLGTPWRRGNGLYVTRFNIAYVA